MAEGPVGQPVLTSETTRGIVRLTFDAEHPNRPHHEAGGAEAILDVLAAHGVRATFFLQGRWASAYPRVARRIAQDGHTIGSHSNAHIRMTRLSDQGIEAEVKESQERIHDATGADPSLYFRCPYGDGHDDPRVRAVIASLTYELVGWDIDPEDWNEARGAAHLMHVIEATLEARTTDAPIVLLHTWPAPTPPVVQGLLERYANEMTWTPLTNHRRA